MKRYLLTDFDSEYWKNINMESVKTALSNLTERMTIYDRSIFGELSRPDNITITLINATHIISNIELIDKKIYGNVKFIEHANGKIAKMLIESGGVFAIRSTGKDFKNPTEISEIITWDIDMRPTITTDKIKEFLEDSKKLHKDYGKNYGEIEHPKIKLYYKLLNWFKKILERKYKTITVKIPKNWSNCAVTIDNHFIADSNDSTNFDSLKFPLPKPKYKWNIKNYSGNLEMTDKYVYLIDK